MLDKLKLIVWDVQHGNAIYIRTPDERDVIIDLGVGRNLDKKEKFSPIDHLRKRYGLRKIDLLVLTHPHTDHIEDILEVIKLPIAQAILPFHLKRVDYLTDRVRKRDKPLYNTYHELSKEFDWQDAVSFGDVTFQFFRHEKASRSRMNDHSVVTVIHYLKYKIVLMGDNENISQRALLKDDRFIKASSNCNVFLTPHHGRKYGYYSPMLGHLNPGLSIVSDAKPGHTALRNKYSEKSKGMEVRIEEVRQTRNVLSTNNDGVIIGELGIYEGKPKIKIQAKKIGRR